MNTNQAAKNKLEKIRTKKEMKENRDWYSQKYLRKFFKLISQKNNIIYLNKIF
jgi:hypothetical protein